jgi:hypothetical protein
MCHATFRHDHPTGGRDEQGASGEGRGERDEVR